MSLHVSTSKLPCLYPVFLRGKWPSEYTDCHRDSHIQTHTDARMSMGSRFPSNPIIIRVPFFLMFSFNKETQNKKGKRVLLGYLGV